MSLIFYITHTLHMSDSIDQKKYGTKDVENAAVAKEEGSAATRGSTSSYGTGQSAALSDPVAEKVEAIRRTTASIKEYAILTRETSRALRETGTISDLAVATREIASIIRDIAREIRQTSIELKESGITDEIARSVNETVQTAKDTAQVVRDVATSAKANAGAAPAEQDAGQQKQQSVSAESRQAEVA